MKKDLKGIITISLVIIIFVIIGIFVYKLLTNNETSKYGRYADEEELSTILSNSFNLYSKCETGKDFNLTEGQTITAKDLTKENILHIVFQYLQLTNKFDKVDKTSGATTIRVSSKTIKQGITEIFGKAFAASFEIPNAFNISGGKFTLNNNLYTGTITLDGCMSGQHTRFYNSRNYFENDYFVVEYTLYWHKVYELQPGLAHNAYNNANLTDVICLEDDLESNFEEFTRYSYIFKREDSNYILDHIELVN